MSSIDIYTSSRQMKYIWIYTGLGFKQKQMQNWK